MHGIKVTPARKPFYKEVVNIILFPTSCTCMPKLFCLSDLIISGKSLQMQKCRSQNLWRLLEFNELIYYIKILLFRHQELCYKMKGSIAILHDLMFLSVSLCLMEFHHTWNTTLHPNWKTRGVCDKGYIRLFDPHFTVR